MNTKLRAWISAARPRTLPLSISGILVGSAYAYLDLAFAKAEYPTPIDNITSITTSNYTRLETFYWMVPVMALITTLGFQILSNFANDYGDGVKGTDNDERIGPMRALQSGIIKPVEMKTAMLITSIITIICAIVLVYISLGSESVFISIFFIFLGLTAIWAAIKYTVGDNAYGYKGLGDLFVFIFFGPVSVMGVYYLIVKRIDLDLILPSITVGLLSVAVLNLNNMRDIASDKKSGKNTIPVAIGFDSARKLHYGYLFGAIVTLLIFLIKLSTEYGSTDLGITLLLFIPCLFIVPILRHFLFVKNVDSSILLDPELKKVALSTFFMAILIVISVGLYTNFYN